MSFKYRDRVVISQGFYAGYAGIVVEEAKHLFTTEYRVYLDIERPLWVNSNHLLIQIPKQVKRRK
jgi:hypothetical protein